jgi:hypothetical protein
VLKLTTSHLSNNGLLQLKACFYGSLVLLFVTGAEAGNDTYEPTQPPRIIANTAARNAIGGFGHPYITLGTDDASGRDRRRWLIPRSADDDHWSKFGLPVTGMLGVSYDDPTLAFELLSTRRRVSASSGRSVSSQDLGRACSNPLRMGSRAELSIEI